jgi:hypothetical protein
MVATMGHVLLFDSPKRTSVLRRGQTEGSSARQPAHGENNILRSLESACGEPVTVPAGVARTVIFATFF